MDKKKRVLVTGATGTLGQALVKALLNADYHVVANFFHDEERALELHRKMGCDIVRCDVSDEASVECLFAQQKFDAVFHLAAISCDALLLRTSRQGWERTLKTNLQATFLLTRAALQSLPRGGHLVLVSSRVGERGFTGQSAYAASKAAVLGLMKTAAREGMEEQIWVNAICPGFAPSMLSPSLSEKVLIARRNENWLAEANAAQSFAALGVWLLQTKLTGQVLRPDCRI